MASRVKETRVRDALKNYLALASGLTEVTKQQAKNVAKSLVKQGEATRGQVDKIADELVSTSRANRAVIVSIVRTGVDKALSRFGVATADEVARLTRRLQDLEGTLRSAAADDAKPATTATAAAGASKATAKPGARKPTGSTRAGANGTAKPTAGAATKPKSGTPAKPAKAARPSKAAKPSKKADGSP